MSRILSRNQDLLTALVAQLNDYVVLLCDQNGLITSWHSPIQDQLGYSASDIMGTPIQHIFATDGGHISLGNPAAVFRHRRQMWIGWWRRAAKRF